jgi:hypothetical protein
MPLRYVGGIYILNLTPERDKQSAFCSNHCTPRGEATPVTTRYEAEWAPKPIWVLAEEKNLSPCQESNPDRPPAA